MKSTLINYKEKEKEGIKYPCLMEFIPKVFGVSTLIVLATSQNTGTVVYSTRTNPVGEYDTSWKSFNSKEYWKKFEGKINLEN